MTRKREVERPYPPEYLSAESLGHYLDISRSSVDDYVKRGILPKPLRIGGSVRFRRSDVEVAIAESNGELAPTNGTALSIEEDAFSAGIKSVTPSHA